MRIVKDAKERRNEILDVAGQLFSEKGYDATSTNDILEKVNIARGTLYYHFKSKEEIMDALIERYNEQILNRAREIVSQREVPVLERIGRVVLALNIEQDGGEEILAHIHKPQNALMHQKIQRSIIHEVPPILGELITEGIEQGIFETPYPLECMEMVVIYMTTLFDQDMVELTNEEVQKRMEAFLFHMERLLGAKGGSFAFFAQIIGR
ncbi:MAG: hypothetical protein PWP24_1168 [Clostridiales bacterium]|nr:hypothetical protein [Clostridiales bacterium]